MKDLEAKHRQWWREFWTKSLVEIGDPVLDRQRRIPIGHLRETTAGKQRAGGQYQ